ncbi:winged helix-turn-helix transcriptional regulator [Limosilactobacillus sp. STM2_1]|uniref:Winged helix-turn-helix transcriptional regulator n=1 Tax=Limosilactobacillus rudii TaxID=2759755 RepID=A0A7W3YMB3_9LACO|nr:MarR family winged helix-turn-helix transcriptional regulator [Limosilactobacillus rudii]MBB1079200.1 winged helix-turn-helix transcriptional regulator [Limosilactobacillus rudii]MBB1097289.1 winged helix-turn-helix transcriptional regulator [Limosilactobacillus rudii]MCD7134398.1 MarR family winged helix-turn-helix transcriptional regulator [Limosilactobacillus rudii]
MLSNNEIENIRAFNRQYTQVLGVLNKRTFDTDLTWPEGRILIEVGVNHLDTPMAVTKALKLDKSYASRTIKKLVDKKILKKTPSPTDSRSINISLTKYGEKVFNDINQKSNDLIKKMIEGLSPAEQDKYFESIQTINKLLFKKGNE